MPPIPAPMPPMQFRVVERLPRQNLILAMNNLEVRNYEGKPFYPEKHLKGLLTEAVIRRELQQYVKDHPEREQYADFLELENSHHSKYIAQHLQKTFAILVQIAQPEIIRDFIHNHYKDSHLPLSMDRIEAIPGLSKSFMSRQYQFLAPVVASPELMKRDWGREYVVPFTKKELICDDKGMFGFVYEVEIEPSYDRINYRPKRANKEVYACKELKMVGGGTSKRYEHEVAVLDLFRKHLKRENIVPLLARFVHGDMRYLIFPRAKCDLEDFFKNEAAPRDTTAFNQQLKRISALASALASLHHMDENPKIQEAYDGLGMLACHRDLTLKNILWIDNKFMISDFGAARIRKRDVNGTGGPWEMGQRGPYAAPECIRDRIVGRAADVWSLGCIFAEFLTWAAGGSARLKEFQEMRKTIRADAGGSSIGYPDFSFHQNGHVKDSVMRWLDRYDGENFSSDNRVQFVRIVKKMLRVGVMEDEKSISAGEVNNELRVLFPGPMTPKHLSLSQDMDPGLRLLEDLSDLDTVFLIDDTDFENHSDDMRIAFERFAKTVISYDDDGIDIEFVNASDFNKKQIKSLEESMQIFDMAINYQGSRRGRTRRVLGSILGEYYRMYAKAQDEGKRLKPLNLIVISTGFFALDEEDKFDSNIKRVVLKSASAFDNIFAPDEQIGIQFCILDYRVEECVLREKIIEGFDMLDNSVHQEYKVRDMVDAQIYHVDSDADNSKILAKILCGANNRRIDEMLPD